MGGFSHHSSIRINWNTLPPPLAYVLVPRTYLRSITPHKWWVNIHKFNLDVLISHISIKFKIYAMAGLEILHTRWLYAHSQFCEIRTMRNVSYIRTEVIQTLSILIDEFTENQVAYLWNVWAFRLQSALLKLLSSNWLNYILMYNTIFKIGYQTLILLIRCYIPEGPQFRATGFEGVELWNKFSRWILRRQITIFTIKVLPHNNY